MHLTPPTGQQAGSITIFDLVSEVHCSARMRSRLHIQVDTSLRPYVLYIRTIIGSDNQGCVMTISSNLDTFKADNVDRATSQDQGVPRWDLERNIPIDGARRRCSVTRNLAAVERVSTLHSRRLLRAGDVA